MGNEVTEVTAESVVAEFMRTLQAANAETNRVAEFMRTSQAPKVETSRKESKPGPWFLDRTNPDQTRELIRSLVPFIAELDLWRISVPKCWVYHPRTVRGLLAAKSRWEEVDAHDATTGSVGFYTLTLRDVSEQLLTFELEREHLIGANEVPTIEDLEEFLVSLHFETLYGKSDDSEAVAA